MEENHVQVDAEQVHKTGYRKFEIALLFVLGVLVGFSAKTEASKKITMGSEDYRVSQKHLNAYDINAIQKELIAKGESSGLMASQPNGGSCGQ